MRTLVLNDSTLIDVRQQYPFYQFETVEDSSGDTTSRLPFVNDVMSLFRSGLAVSCLISLLRLRLLQLVQDLGNRQSNAKKREPGPVANFNL